MPRTPPPYPSEYRRGVIELARRGVAKRLAHSGRGSYSGLDPNRWPNNAPRKTSTVAVPVQRRPISTLCRESAFRVELETHPKVFKGATN
jgi:hypothetical protein